MASWACKMAVENPHVVADVIEIGEFVDLRDKYSVTSVPKVVVNETIPYEGPWVAQTFLQHIVGIGESQINTDEP